MIAFHPQKMLVANLDQPVYRGYHGPFTRLVRRCDDSNTPRLDRRLMGAVSVLRGRLTLELSPCARSAPSSNPLSCREDLVASCDRTRCQRRGRYHRALLLHGQALHAGPRPGEEARAFFARAPWRSPRRTKAANARDPQL